MRFPIWPRFLLGLCLAIWAFAAVPAQAADAGGLVNALVQQLGVTRPQAEGGAGALFGLARQRMQPDQFGQVQQAIPGLDGLLAKAPRPQSASGGRGSGGGLGGLAEGALGSAGAGGVTGSLGALAPLAGSFSSLGLSPETAGRFLPVVLDYLNGSGGAGAAGLLKGALGG